MQLVNINSNGANIINPDRKSLEKNGRCGENERVMEDDVVEGRDQLEYLLGCRDSRMDQDPCNHIHVMRNAVGNLRNENLEARRNVIDTQSGDVRQSHKSSPLRHSR
jgi:hypothetical protein